MRKEKKGGGLDRSKLLPPSSHTYGKRKTHLVINIITKITPFYFVPDKLNNLYHEPPYV